MSLRARLLLALGVAACLALVVADVVTYSVLRSSLLDQVDQSLSRAELALAHGPPGSAAGSFGYGPPPGTVAHDTPGAFVQQRDANGSVVFETPAVVAGGQHYTPSLPRHISVGAGGVTYLTTSATTSSGPEFRARVTEFGAGTQLVVAVPLTSQQETLHRLFLTEITVTAAALVLAVLLGWWLVRLGLRPLVAVEETAEAIAEGTLDRRVPGEEAKTEVGRLARSLNVMLGRIQQAFGQRVASEAALRRSEERMRRFVADASHELRTPLAAVSAYAELFGRGAVDNHDDLNRVLQGISKETDRMKVLVEDLVLLARLDEGRPLERRGVELVALCAEAVDTASAVGPTWPATLRATHPVEVEGDGTRLRQVVDNLLANVRAHTPEGTEVTVSIEEHQGQAVISVADRGPGLTEEQAARVFDRFYRADPSRNRASGGSGLGLAIVAAIVHAHHGQVYVASEEGHGTTFTVTLPLA